MNSPQGCLPATGAPGENASSIDFLHALLQDGPLDRRMRIRIALYLAQRGRSAFRPDSLRDCGRDAGMNGAEMAANRQGSSHDAKGDACLLFVKALLDDPQAPTLGDIERMRHAGYRQEDVADVMVNVGINIVLSGLARLIDAPGNMMHCGQANSLRPDAA